MDKTTQMGTRSGKLSHLTWKKIESIWLIIKVELDTNVFLHAFHLWYHEHICPILGIRKRTKK
jgi:hypothetical protein